MYATGVRVVRGWRTRSRRKGVALLDIVYGGKGERLFSRALLLDRPRNLGRRAKFIHSSANRVKVCFTDRDGGVLGPRGFAF